MAFVLADRVKETASAPGTGTVTLLGAATGYQSFSAGIGASNTTYYTIADQTGSNWEVGYGTIGAGGTTLARTTVLASSNSGSLVNFSSGTQDVWCDYPASKAAYGLTAGTGISVTPGAGTLTLANTGVTSVTGTAPVVSSGGTTPAISMAAATTSVNGYLTSTDWNTFNSKLSTAVTSAVAGTGISLSGSTGAVTITNSAPDQTVSLTGGTGISTSGTYPNFTITNTGTSSLVATVYGVGAYSYMQISGGSRSAGSTVAGSSCNAISHISNQSNSFAPNWYQQGTQSGTWQCMSGTTGGNSYSIVLMQRIS